MNIDKKNSVVKQIIKHKGSISIPVEGSSMVPTIYPTFRVMVVERNDPVENGEIVVFRNSGRNIVHRVYKKEMVNGVPYITTKGDSIFALDVPVPIDCVLGMVKGIYFEGKFKKINGCFSRHIWKALMPIQLMLGKSKLFIPYKVHSVLKKIILRLLGCVIEK